jgi:hypothetical protein
MKQRKQKSSKKSLHGTSALNRMARWSSDQARNFATKRYTGRSAASNIAHDLGVIRSLINAEEKNASVLFTQTTVTAASPYILPLGTVAQGNTGETRTGDSIKITRIDMSLRFAFGTGTSNLYCNQIFKWFLVRYLKTPAASGATAFSIGEFLDQDFAGNRSSVSLFSTDTSEYFQIMDCGVVTVTPSFALAAVNNTALSILDISHQCSYHQTYNGAAAANICDNMAFLVVVASQAANTAGTSTVDGSTRLLYIDN